MLRIPLILLLAIHSAGACIWDRDTLKEEAKGRLDTVTATTGRFDRYPARYYEMRLERVTKELEEKPGVLDLYDDAGVACSRLGRHDDAIIWMAKKAEALVSMPVEETNEERYRYLSNLGTFLLIRWIVQPEAERSADLTDLQASETFIRQALQLNPDAHFGREKFQYKLIRWLLDAQSPPEYGTINFLYLEQDRMFAPRRNGGEDFTLEEARKGLTGLIQMGAAWESVDIFQTLQLCLHSQGSMSLAHLAYLRGRELYDSGERSFHPVEEVRAEVVPQPSGGFSEIGRVDAYFKKARAAVMQRDAEWIAYQDERYAKGMHPDTHPDFWKDWKEPEPPKFPRASFLQLAERNESLSMVVLIALIVLVSWAVRVLWRKVSAA